MGSFFETNDTLQITREQGFPLDLDIERHLKHPYTTEEFQGKIFAFRNKSNIRIYQMPPVRNFLVENRDEKWIYWGLCEIQHLELDYVNKTTSGTFKITKMNSPEEMRQVFDMTDGRPEKNYFNNGPRSAGK